MRLFVAIDLDEPLRRAVADAAAGMRRAFERAAGGARVSWTAAERMHVTLHFIGDLAERDARGLIDAFRRPLPLDPFNLEVGAAGIFPPHGRPRVLWLGVSAKGEALPRLHRDVGERLASAGLAEAPAPFTAHLTVARVRSPVRTAAAAGACADVPRRIGACRVDAVTLYESRLGGRNPAYVALASAALAGSSSDKSSDA